MKRITLIPLALLALLLTACEPTGLYRFAVALEGEHTLAAGETIEGDLIILGGAVRLETGARLTGSVYMMGGQFEADGIISGDVTQLSGSITLGASSRIEGDLNSGGGRLELADQAVIEGEVIMDGIQFPDISQQSAAQRWVGLLGQSLILVVLAYVSARYFPAPAARIERAVAGHPVVCGAVGLLVFIVLPVLLVMMAFTIVLIPVTLIGLVATLLVLAYAGIIYGRLIGRQLARVFTGNLAPTPAAILGTLVFVVIINLLQFVPVVGAVVVILAGCVGFGAILLTRFGLIEYVPASEEAPA
jgi:cytoskeletal protein CcmA (bactofilin family)